MSFVSRYLDPTLIERLNSLQLSARHVVEGTTSGLHRSPVKGASIEFRHHRFYTRGDDPRRLDWRVLARTDRPYIKEYNEETNLRCALVLDCSGSMAYGGSATESPAPAPPGKFDYAARTVASLAYLMLRETESVGLALVGRKIEQWLAPRGGPGQLSRLIDVLERAVPRGPSGLGPGMQSVADRLGRRSLVILVSDAFIPVAALAQGLARLRYDRHEVILLQVVHPDEVSFPFRNWTRFRGLEGERARVSEPAAVRRAYLDNFRRHRQALADACRAAGAEFHPFQTDTPLAESVMRFLSRRGG